MPTSRRLRSTTARRILIGALLAAFIWAASGGKAGLWPFAIFFMAIGSVSRLKRIGWRQTPLDLPLLIFLAAALIGVWAAYNQRLALQKLCMLLGAYLLFYAIVIQPPKNLWAIAATFAGLGCVVAIAFLLTTDWQAYPPKFALARRLVHGWDSIRPSLNLRGMHPNVAGGLIALLLPFQLAWLLHSRREHTRSKAPLFILTAGLALSVLALLLSSSRGAILSLALSLTLWILWQQRSPLSPALQKKIRLSTYLLVGAPVVILSLIITVWYSQLRAILPRLPMGASLTERATLAGQTIDLIASFPAIGGGLASFPGLYSRYILGIPYFYLPNGHNILLDLLLEQGLLGVISFILITITTLWCLLRLAFFQNHAVDNQTKLLVGATFSSFIILLLHGMVENTVYGSVGLPLLLTTPAMAMVLNRTAYGADFAWQRHWTRINASILGACGALLIAGMLLPVTRSLWLNNLASIQMARVDLARFPGGQWPDDDETVHLASAQRMFEQSIRLNERQNTAHYRLGLIAMSHQDYEEAVNRLQIAYQNNSDHIGIRKALGYSYAWSGKVDEGIVLLSQAPFVNQDLHAYEKWWRSQGRSDLGLVAAQVRENIQAGDREDSAE